MKKNRFVLVFIILVLCIVVGACTPALNAEPVLTLRGLVEKEYTLDELNAFSQTSSEYTNKDGETTKYTGVAFSVIFNDAKLPIEPTTIKMVAIDAYVGEVTYDEIRDCTDCIIAILEDGTLRSVLPGFSGKANVKDLVSLELQ